MRTIREHIAKYNVKTFNVRVNGVLWNTYTPYNAPNSILDIVFITAKFDARQPTVMIYEVGQGDIR